MSRSVPQWIKDAKYHFCAVCGCTDDLQYHHWVPVALGGETVPENIIVLCAKHHQEIHGQGGNVKHNYLVKDGMMKAKARGVKAGKPSADYEMVMRTIAEKSTQFVEWNPYDPDMVLYTEHEIMKEVGVKGVCYNKCKRMLIEAYNAPEWVYDWVRPKQCLNRPMYDRVINQIRDGVIEWTYGISTQNSGKK